MIKTFLIMKTHFFTADSKAAACKKRPGLGSTRPFPVNCLLELSKNLSCRNYFTVIVATQLPTLTSISPATKANGFIKAMVRSIFLVIFRLIRCSILSLSNAALSPLTNSGSPLPIIIKGLMGWAKASSLLILLGMICRVQLSVLLSQGQNPLQSWCPCCQHWPHGRYHRLPWSEDAVAPHLRRERFRARCHCGHQSLHDWCPSAIQILYANHLYP